MQKILNSFTVEVRDNQRFGHDNPPTDFLNGLMFPVCLEAASLHFLYSNRALQSAVAISNLLRMCQLKCYSQIYPFYTTTTTQCSSSDYWPIIMTIQAINEIAVTSYKHFVSWLLSRNVPENKVQNKVWNKTQNRRVYMYSLWLMEAYISGIVVQILTLLIPMGIQWESQVFTLTQRTLSFLC